ncbi:MAG: hypothetical protein H6828_12635 [Planctomycetes bacterium]|nr:hypothetical protein [Planctomycetota bacterium]
MLVLSLLATCALLDSPGPPTYADVLQPAVHVSPSGEWRLEVDPSRRDGSGPASCRMTCGGELAWERELPVSLWDAGVTDEGRVFGFAYSEGLRRYGTLDVLSLDSSGEVVAHEVEPRHASTFMSGWPLPQGRELVVQGRLDRAFLRDFDRETSRDGPWRSYRVSTGERLEPWQPRWPGASGASIASILDARAVADSELTLIAWSCSSEARHGVCFALLDVSGDAVWRLDRATEFDGGDADEWMRRRDQAERHGMVLAATGASFDLWLPADGQRVSFAVEGAGAAAHVRETGRTAYDPAAARVPHAWPALELSELGVVGLGEPGSEELGPVHDVVALGFGAEGRLELIRAEPEGLRYVELTRAGDVLREVALAAPEGSASGLTWFDGGGERWFACRRAGADTSARRTWAVDVATGNARELRGARGVEVQRVIARVGGGCVLLGSIGNANGSRELLLALDDAGDELWSRGESYEAPEELDTLFAPADLCALPDGSLVVLDTVRTALQRFSADGAFLGGAELDRVWESAPEYPHRVSNDGAAGLWIVDDETLVHATQDGERLAAVELRYPNGAPAELYDSSVAPDGTLWCFDERVVLGWSATGELLHVLGSPPGATGIDEPDAAWVDPLGRVLVHDDRSGAWHVFDAQGGELFVCEQGRDDFDAFVVPTITRAGDVLVPLEEPFEPLDPPRTHRRFTAGSRAGAAVDLGGYAVQTLRRGEGRWVVTSGASRMSLVRPAPAESLEVARRPGGHWLRRVAAFALAPDDARLAVLEVGAYGGDGPWLCLYDGAGAPERELELRHPAGSLCLSNRWAAMLGQRSVYLYDLEREALEPATFELPEGWWRLGFSPDGRELWAIDLQRLRVHRYRLPTE